MRDLTERWTGSSVAESAKSVQRPFCGVPPSHHEPSRGGRRCRSCLHRHGLSFALFQHGHHEIGRSIARSATVLAHEMGHNLGAQHTFHPSNNGRNCRGIMSYGVAPDTWSVCSRDSWRADYNLFVRASGQSRADTCFQPSNGGGVGRTLPPVPRPVLSPTLPPVRRPVSPPTPNPNGGRGCITLTNRDVAFGFRHHAQSGARGVTSDDACRALCNSARGCTIWVRQPSTNTCSLSTQNGQIRVVQRADRNMGTRCLGTTPVPLPTSRPTSPPTDSPTAPPTDSPTAPPTDSPTAPTREVPTASPTNGAGCRTFLGRDVNSGFRHHAQSFASGVTSDNACRDRCTAARGCTAWVRQPSTNRCWLSTQTGSIMLRRHADRNTGLRCEGTEPVPEAPACRCSE